MRWLKWAAIVLLVVVAIPLYALIGFAVAVVLPVFLWRDWFKVRSRLASRASLLGGVKPGLLSLASFAVLGLTWFGLVSAFTANAPAVIPSPVPVQFAALPSLSPTPTAALATPTTNTLTSTPNAAPTIAPPATLQNVVVAATPTILPTAIPVPASTPTQAAQALIAVAEVVDGDTIKVSFAGRTESIRIIGIDTPEVVDPREPVQCFGREASAKAKELLGGQQVRLVTDPTQGERDKYDRLLRYVEKVDGTDFGLWMVANGYAHEYTYNVPYQRQPAYKASQAQAREKSLGFWSPSACNGDTKQPATSAATATPAAQPTTTPPAAGAPAPTATLAATPNSTLEIVSLTNPVSRNATAKLVAQTTPNAQCTITVVYKSGPSTAAGLGPKTAGSDGRVSWSWNIGSNTSAGDWPVTVTCSGVSKTAYLGIR